MSDISKLERAMQNRVIVLFRDEFQRTGRIRLV